MPELLGKSPLFSSVFQLYLEWRLRRNFADVRLLGGEGLKAKELEGGFILACNHVAWWDPLLLIHLGAHLKAEGYCLMDLQNLQQFSFFRWLGALPIDRSSRRSAYRDLKRAGELLPKRGRILAIFPQGRQRPAHLPLQLKSGVAFLAQASGVPVLPLAIRYDFSEGPKPLAHLSVGSPILWTDEGRRGNKLFMQKLDGALTEGLSQIDTALLQPSGSGESLLGRSGDAHHAGRRSVLSKILHLSAAKQ
jgi:1-acyl-sn-glycerol-3-phosphate acyltransferase